MERRGGLERVVDLLGRVVDIRAQEITVALGSFITFALVLGSYYLIRPIRENIGAEASADQRQLWFLLVFAVMLAAVPLFGWAVARLRRSLIVPGLYIFFAALMMLFWVALEAAGSQWLRASIASFTARRTIWQPALTQRAKASGPHGWQGTLPVPRIWRLQDYLGHKSIKNTACYTRMSARRFEGL